MITYKIGRYYEFTKDEQTVTGRVEGVNRNIEANREDVRIAGIGWVNVYEWEVKAIK
jgi:outer membrane protein assembly factor BamD (BamD/ComL family)